ncbi:MAG: hypothetical protein AAB602_03795 [Patescibacteria group bacterium]
MNTGEITLEEQDEQLTEQALSPKNVASAIRALGWVPDLNSADGRKVYVDHLRRTGGCLDTGFCSGS